MATEVGYGIVFSLKYLRALRALHDYHFKPKTNRQLRNYFDSLLEEQKEDTTCIDDTPRLLTSEVSSPKVVENLVT